MNPMRYYGKLLPILGCFMIAHRTLWKQLVPLYETQLHLSKDSRYGHDEETILYLIWKENKDLFCDIKKILKCFLTVKPGKLFYDFVKKLPEQENIYICIDDDQHIIPNYDGEIKIIKENADECHKHGFHSSICWFPNRSASRDKALYFLYKNQIYFDYIWFVEEDVFIPTIMTIQNIDSQYPNPDLLVSKHDISYEYKTDNHWDWWSTVYKQVDNNITPPFAKSMICAIRCSKQLLQLVFDYAVQHKTLFLDEVLFNTLALQNNLHVQTIVELENILFKKHWTETDIKATHLYHPVKNIDIQYQYREKMISPSNYFITKFTSADKDTVNDAIMTLECTKHVKNILTVIKYLFPPFCFEEPVITESLVLELLDNIANDPPSSSYYANLLVNTCLLYDMSYININKRNILIQSNTVLSTHFKFRKDPINYHAKNHPHKQYNPAAKIKILFIGFYLFRNGTITSVFRDRAETIKRLDSTTFEKHLLIESNETPNELRDSLVASVDNVLYAKSIDINNGFFDFIDQIRAAQFDIVVFPSIGMHNWSTLFASNRLAPVQITTWGHSVTSGIDTVDYYLSSKLYEVEDYATAQAQYSEKLVTLDSLGTCYLAPRLDNPKTKQELKLPDAFLLSCLQNTRKLNMEFLYVLRDIVMQIPNSVVLLMKGNLPTNKLTLIRTLLKDKVMFVDKCDLWTYNSYVHHSDIVLDTYPFGSCNGSFEAFALGKIIVTRPSAYLPGRFTYGFYKKMDIMDAIVDTFDDYIRKVVYFYHNPVAKVKLEQRILNRKHVLFNDHDSVVEWEQTLINLHKNHRMDEGGQSKKTKQLKFIHITKCAGTSIEDI